VTASTAFVTASSTTRRKPPKVVAAPAYRGVEGWVGPPGSGKTYLMVERLRLEMLAGFQVFTNAGFEVVIHEDGCSYPEDVQAYHVRRAALRRVRDTKTKLPKPPRCSCRMRSDILFSIEEAAAVPDGACVGIDEAATFFNSHDSRKMPRGVLWRLSQVRKDDIKFFYSAIREMQVDVNIRGIGFFVNRCRRLGRLRLFKCETWPPIDGVRADDKAMYSKHFRIKPKVFRCYDTMAKVWMAPDAIRKLIDDAREPFVPMSDELSEAILLRDPEAMERALEVAKAEAREYQDAQAAARGAACGPEAAAAVADEEPQFVGGYGQCDRCLEFRPVGYDGSAWVCKSCVPPTLIVTTVGMQAVS
jgi:hypothetical protein